MSDAYSTASSTCFAPSLATSCAASGCTARARGERPGPESDVDIIVITGSGLWADRKRVHWLLYQAAEAEGAEPAYFSIQVGDPQWLEQRRAIESFFIQEVDRDKIVVAGEP